MEFYKYRTNYLTNVICRIDFSPILEIKNHEPEKYQAEINELFPTYEMKKIVELKTTFLKDKKINEEEVISQYNFHNKEERRKVTFTYDHIFVEFCKYKDFRNFISVLKKVFNTFFNIYNPSDLKRLGLRYINQIYLDRGNPFSWKNYIDSSLTHVIHKFIDKIDKKENLAKAMNQIILDFDDYRMNFLYGLNNSQFPSKISRKEFILDYDCYSETFEKDYIYDLVKTFNEKIAYMFENCIKKGLREKMGVIK